MQQLGTRERRKRAYTKRNTDFWSVGKSKLAKRQREACISRQMDERVVAETTINTEKQKKKKKNSQKRKKGQK